MDPSQLTVLAPLITVVAPKNNSQLYKNVSINLTIDACVIRRCATNANLQTSCCKETKHRLQLPDVPFRGDGITE